MTEYDILRNIFNERFLSKSQKRLIEEKGSLKPQLVDIDETGRTKMSWTLYKFEMDECNFLPFFSNQDGSPKGLCKFCDYIMLVESRTKTYVILIEMKRGKSGEAEKQLYASEVFMNYIFSTADRLHTDFDSDSFDIDSIILRKVKLKQMHSPKTTTIMQKVDLTQNFITYNSTGIFPIAQFL